MSVEHVNYLQPKTLQELQKGLKSLTEKSALLAGGTDLMVSIREKKPQIDTYLSLCNINEMKSITEIDGWIRIGAMVTHTEAALNNKIKTFFSALSMACDHVGSPQIRNKGTIGGNIMNANPAGDVLPCIMLFNGEFEIFNSEGSLRRISVNEFLSESGKTTLNKNELLMAIWLPIKPDKKSCFVKLGSRTEVTIAQISFCLSWKRINDEYLDIEAYIGAIDNKPLKIDEINEILGNRPFETESLDALSTFLSNKIRDIRINRKRESKLKIYEHEKLYKERAVKGVVYDAISFMKY
ncbi:MAG: ndhF 1 [Bacillota bacterium]|jgi:carbon-monoxide dehydrogenase medium subunit|nr:ndhF 1 [Bacillota bacterium]